MDSRLADTVALFSPTLAADKYFFKSAIDLGFEFGAASHAGNWRSENQDHYVVVRRRRLQEALLTSMAKDELSLPMDESFAMAVADGMGGMGRGDLAARLAIRTAWELAGRTTSWVMRLAELHTSDLEERVMGFTHLMQQAFLDESDANPELAESGTTWTCACLVSSFAIVANVGDSPCFLWRDGTMRRVSTDHTVEQEFVAVGIRPEIAAQYSHVLTRCLGAQTNNAQPDVHQLRIQPGDQLLICTDGLSTYVEEPRIAECLDGAASAQQACEGLIELALAAGGKDNVTAVLARVQSPAA